MCKYPMREEKAMRPDSVLWCPREQEDRGTNRKIQFKRDKKPIPCGGDRTLEQVAGSVWHLHPWGCVRYNRPGQGPGQLALPPQPQRGLVWRICRVLALTPAGTGQLSPPHSNDGVSRGAPSPVLQLLWSELLSPVTSDPDCILHI